MSIKNLRDASEWALLVAMVLGLGAIAQAQEDTTTQPEGRLVQIGPSDDQPIPATTEADTTGIVPEQRLQMAAPKYWIGLLGGPVEPALRAHIDLPEDQGILVREVVSESPAAAAGLQAYDILLSANGVPLYSMGDLVELVRTQGAGGGAIQLEVLRHGNSESISVTPAERPEPLAGPGYGTGSGMMAHPGMQSPESLWRHFAQRFGQSPGGSRQFPSLGSGAMAGGHSSVLADMPNGISVSIERENDQPPHITVKRGNDSWDIVGDDPQALHQLPDDVRPFVEHLLHGSMHLGFQGSSPPGAPARMPWAGQPPTLPAQELRERVEAMERHIKELQKQMLGPNEEDSQQPQ